MRLILLLIQLLILKINKLEDVVRINRPYALAEPSDHMRMPSLQYEMGRPPRGPEDEVRLRD